MSDHRANTVVQFTPPAVPFVSFTEMERLAQAIAKSGLFGIKTPDQALALMALAQAEGRHPATVARDYHIINGSPSKKAEAMQRDFLMAGGRIEWLELTDEAVEATFSHPQGGSATIRWDTARCKQAGLLGGNHQKFPRQMKRSRVVSEGVRTVWPMATSGFYVPEEVAEFAPEPVADTRPDLDSFAAAKTAETFDRETGEIVDAAALERDAREIAAQGTMELRGFLRGIGRDARAALNGKIGTREAPGELLLLAMRADDAAQPEAEEDPFGLPPVEQPESSAEWLDGFNATEPKLIDLASNATDWRTYVEAVIYHIGHASKADLAALDTVKHTHLKRLRAEDHDQFRLVTQAIAARARELAGGSGSGAR